MISSARVVSGLLVLSAGCREDAASAPPSTSASTAGADEDETETETEGALILEAKQWRPQLYAVDEAMDLVLPRSLDFVRDNLWDGGRRCFERHCVVALMQPAERLEFRAEAAAAIEITGLPLPEARPIHEGETLRFPLALIDDEDPRGAFVDVTIELEAPREALLEWRTLAGTGAKGCVLPPVEIEVVGEGGPLSAHVSMMDPKKRPTYRGARYLLPAGTTRLRQMSVGRQRPPECSFAALPGVELPPWCEGTLCEAYEVELRWSTPDSDEAPLVTREPQQGPERAADGLLSLGRNEVAFEPAPEPAQLSLEVQPGQDLVLRWQPEATGLFYDWKVSEQRWASGRCAAQPCRFHRVPFDHLTVSIPNAEAPERVSLELVALPPPPTEYSIASGEELELSLDRVAVEDPRGPLADVELQISEPGRYQLELDYDEGDPRPNIVVLGDPPFHDTGLQALGSAPYLLREFDITAAGTYLVRVLSCPDCADQRLRMTLKRRDP